MGEAEKIKQKIVQILGLRNSSPILETNRVKFIFININKTAGTSILNVLGVKKKQHLTSKEVIGQIGRHKWDQTYKFSIVRNPWAKVYSHYNYRIKTNQTELRETKIDFNQWVKEAYEIHNPQFYDKPKMFATQLEWLRNDQNELDIDFIGKFENLSEDFNIIKNKLKLKKDLPHLNATKRNDFRGYYNDESIEIIDKCFKEDIEYFNYKF